MKLFEHPDFEQAIVDAAEHFRPLGLRAAVIEKDYYVTETLRAVATTGATKVVAAGGSGGGSLRSVSERIIFKGGTSFSKGWNLIARFSEDVVIFLDPLGFDPPLGKSGIDRELKALRNVEAEHPALTFVAGEQAGDCESAEGLLCGGRCVPNAGFGSRDRGCDRRGDA